jgi:hypothetical protein
MVIFAEIYRNSVTPRSADESTFKVSRLSQNILLVMIFVSVIQPDPNRYMFGTGVYALIQGIALIVFHFGFKKNLTRS